MGNEELTAAVRVLAELRQEYTGHQAHVEEARQALNVTPEAVTFAARVDTASMARQQLSAVEERVRTLTIAAYEADPEHRKQVAAGVGIRETTALEYDPDVALMWAKSHDMALALDKRAFETIAKASLSAVPFVTERKLPVATIAADLDKVLPAPVPEPVS